MQQLTERVRSGDPWINQQKHETGPTQSSQEKRGAVLPGSLKVRWRSRELRFTQGRAAGGLASSQAVSVRSCGA